MALADSRGKVSVVRDGFSRGYLLFLLGAVGAVLPSALKLRLGQSAGRGGLCSVFDFPSLPLAMFQPAWWKMGPDSSHPTPTHRFGIKVEIHFLAFAQTVANVSASLTRLLASFSAVTSHQKQT